MSQTKLPPSDWKGILKQLGPGLIISANIVGSGELIVTTKLGADVGFAMLWFIILGCLIKVFLQIELGRYAIGKGKSTLETLNSVPGPRLGISWLMWCWLVMFLATFFQLTGMIGSLTELLQMAGSQIPESYSAFLICASCSILLFIGRYGFIEAFSTSMVALFTIFTIFAVFSLHWTNYGITSENLTEGFSFKLPENFTTAFAAFGVIGVGASELIYYPYWCLEKGYARWVGTNDGSADWKKRAEGWMKVMQCDAWISAIFYTIATVAFYLLGAAVLHGKGLSVTNKQMMPTLSSIYQSSFGTIGLIIFLIGAGIVLYSTLFISTASNARLTIDLLHLGNFFKTNSKNSKHHKHHEHHKGYENEDRENDYEHYENEDYEDREDSKKRRGRRIQIACLLLPILYFIFYIAVGKQPLTLVTIGALAQAVMLPLLCFAALYFHFTAAENAFKASKTWMIFLCLASFLMTSVGVYEMIKLLQKIIS